MICSIHGSTHMTDEIGCAACADRWWDTGELEAPAYDPSIRGDHMIGDDTPMSVLALEWGADLLAALLIDAPRVRVTQGMRYEFLCYLSRVEPSSMTEDQLHELSSLECLEDAWAEQQRESYLAYRFGGCDERCLCSECHPEYSSDY